MPMRSVRLRVVISHSILPNVAGTTHRRNAPSRLLIAVAAAWLACFVGIAAAGDRVTVFAAASLKEALDENAKRFEAETGNTVVIAYGASNALARQIEAGAPAHLFISADGDWMDHVEQRGALVPGSRLNLLTNDLVLIAPAVSSASLRIAPNFGLSAALGDGKLAMANPESVPAGKYGRAALTALGVWSAVEKRVVRADNVRAALALVARGEAAFGIVYKTDASADQGVRIVDAFPASTHAPIVYPAALIAPVRSPAARALLESLRSPAARTIWAKNGFGVL
jgi:molybdate transport system substrate-binding protein